MKLAQLFPIQNCLINGYSLIENVFGSSFVVYDAMGEMLTTGKNVKLIGRAQTLLENLPLCDAVPALDELRKESDQLTQGDYDYSVWREYQCVATHDDGFFVMAGSFE
jgi:hypothetical protein